MIAMRILIADPDAALLQEFTQYFASRGAQVVTATNGLECIDFLRSFEPDVLVLEPDMLWGGGEGVLARMRSERDIPSVPVVVLTAARDKDQFSRVMDFPIEEFLPKPVSAKQLGKRLRVIGNARRQIGEAANPLFVITDAVCAVVANCFEVARDEITGETCLVEDLGADSIDMLVFATQLETEFNVVLPVEAVSDIRTVRDAIPYLLHANGYLLHDT